MSASQMSSDVDFKYDVFLSHSSKDKDAVREIASRLSVKRRYSVTRVRAGY
jgi:hypothetical protein